MKQIIIILSLIFIIVLSSVSINGVQQINERLINSAEGEFYSEWSFADWLQSFLQTGASVTSGGTKPANFGTCTYSKAFISHTIATSGTLGSGAVSAGITNGYIVLYDCLDGEACTSKSSPITSEAYIINSVKPSFSGLVIDHYYYYKAYSCAVSGGATDCTSGNYKCTSNEIYKCVNGQWQDELLSCQYGCKSENTIYTSNAVCQTSSGGSTDCFTITAQSTCTVNTNPDCTWVDGNYYKCVESTFKCIDSDNGNDYYTKGYAIDQYGDKTEDVCVDSTRISEQYCDNGISREYVYSKVGYICQDGKLVVDNTNPTNQCSDPLASENNYYCYLGEIKKCVAGNWVSDGTCSSTLCKDDYLVYTSKDSICSIETTPSPCTTPVNAGHGEYMCSVDTIFKCSDGYFSQYKECSDYGANYYCKITNQVSTTTEGLCAKAYWCLSSDKSECHVSTTACAATETSYNDVDTCENNINQNLDCLANEETFYLNGKIETQTDLFVLSHTVPNQEILKAALPSINNIIPSFSEKYKFSNEGVCCSDKSQYVDSKVSETGSTWTVLLFQGGKTKKISYDVYKCSAEGSIGTCPEIVQKLPTYFGMKADCGMGWIFLIVAAVLIIVIIMVLK